MTRIIILLTLVVTCTLALLSQNKSIIRGTVTDEEGKLVIFANVFIQGTPDGTTSDEHGKFAFETAKSGEATLIVSLLGYKRCSLPIYLSPTQPAIVKVTMNNEALKSKGVVILASAYSTEKTKGSFLTKMDILMTPGGAADIYQSIKTLPGVTQVSENAELYVRGGDPDETVTLIDQAAIYHPYTYESAYGGVFSNINTNIMNGMFFSSGGFSAKYGNVLSGVLDIDTKDEPTELSNAVGLSMACASLSSQIPIAGNTAGVRIETRRSYTKPIFWLNGGSEQFVSFPASRDINTSVTYRYSPTGRVKLMGIFADDQEEVNVDRPEYHGVFKEESNKDAISLQVKDVFQNVLFVKSCLAYTTFESDWKLGVLNLIRADEVLQWRTDAEYQWTPFRCLVFGGETQMRTTAYSGIVPADNYNMRPDANRKAFNSELHSSRFGTYVELEQSHLFGAEQLFASIGCRYDATPMLDLQWVDPRFRIGYQLGEHAAIKVGWGIYHQQPDIRLFNPEDGNPNLLPERAIHTIIGFDQKIADQYDIRLELYYKEYSQLPLKDSLANYSSYGSGYARGIDFTAKGEVFSGLHGWIGYGYLDTRRHWLDYTESSPSSYDITHNLTIVLEYSITASWHLGATYKYATGRPYTPIVGSQYYPTIDLYAPIYGPTNSARYKGFQRLDMRLSHYTRLFGVAFTVIYLEALNILNIHNMYGYTYTPDYSEQREIYSCFGRRILVLGMIMNF
jgi:hypothetical protein